MRWNARINLVSRGDVAHLWPRHIQDCLQLRRLVPQTAQTAFDLGSGAGFPGLILAMVLQTRFTLVEADTRKAAFLQEAARITATKVTILNCRIEDVQAPKADLITARALAPVSRLLELAQPLLRPGGIMLFLKGSGVEAEIAEAERTWTLHTERHISATSEGGVILRISEVERA